MASFSGLDNAPAYTENGLRVVLDADATIVGAAAYDGATLVLVRQGGASPNDFFGDDGGILILSEGQVLIHEFVVDQGDVPILVGAYTNSEGTLAITFNADATEARVNAVLARITYANDSETPPTSVTIDYTFDDGLAPATGSIIVGLTAADDPPTIDWLDPGATYAPGSAGVVLAPNIAFSDPDSTTLAQASVTIMFGVAGDILAADPGATGIVVSYDPGTFTLTLSGVASLDDYRAVLATVAYSSSAADPTNGFASASRGLTWTLDDGGGGLSQPSGSNVYFLPVIDLDASSAGTGFAASFTEDGAGVAVVDTDIVITPGSFPISSVRMVLTNAKDGDALAVNGALPPGLSFEIDTSVDGQIALTVNGIASPATYQSMLQQVTFSNSSQNPDLTIRDLAVTVFDQNVGSDPVHTAITVTGIDDAGIAEDDAVSTDELTPIGAGLNVFADNGFGPDTDPDTMVVTEVNGVAANVGVQITLASGALLTLNADGTFVYDPNGAFQATPAHGIVSGASNAQASDSFSYGVVGGDAATVVITIDGVDNNDVLLGTASGDTLFGGVGVDSLEGLAGDDALNGGDGRDIASYASAGSGVTVDLALAAAQNTLGAGNDTLASIENLTGSGFNDTLTGNGATNVIRGGAGADTIRGMGGADALAGDTGSDFILGDAGNDTISGGADMDRLYGGSGNDRLLGGAGADTLVGGPGVDRVDGGDGADRLYADATADTFVFGGLTGAGDRVFGFQSGVHTLEINAAGFGGVAGAFDFAASLDPIASGAPGAQQAFLYDSDGGYLYFDADGNGAGPLVFVLRLASAPLLAASDIVLL